MIIKSMNVKNFRSILDETLYFDNLTVLVGANGSGKSSFLHALEFFQARHPITTDDFYNTDTNNEIVFSITFTNLSDKAKEEFSKYLQNDELTVERVFKFTDDKISDTYHGSTFQNPDFDKIRSCLMATPAKLEYEELKRKEEYQSFPNWTNFEQIKNYLNEWEECHLERCQRSRDDGQFFGYQGVGTWRLEKYIKLLYIPAVKDASSDAIEGKNSVLTTLLDLVIRNELMKKEEIQIFQKEIKERYNKILDNENLKEISKLSQDLTATLNSYVPDAKIDLSWLIQKDFQITLPSAIANLVEDGYRATVDRTGHGLQRVFIMTLLQYLSTFNKIDAGSVGVSDFSTLVLIIEEPELYQHPNRQRHISKICLDLSKCAVDGISSNIQVIYSTHSPHFVGLDRINQVRLLRKQIHTEGMPKITKISTTDISKLTTELSKFHGDKYNESNIIPLLHMIQTPWINEGFFSKCAVLVEGDSDRASILGASNVLKINLESEGISVIPCSGKPNLDKVAIIFRQLGIPIYVIWDNDRDKPEEVKRNRKLLRLFNEPENDYPSHVKDDHAVIEGTLETMLKDEIGEEIYELSLNNCMTEYDMRISNATKNPTIIQTILEDLEQCNGEIPITLKQILEKIKKLNQQ